jgi:hypothetical protein
MADNQDIDPTKIPFNTLNDVSQPIGGRRERLDTGTDFMDALANAAQHQFISDSLQNTGPYKAIVLRVETDNQTPEAGSWLSNTFASFFGTPPQIVKIKARIPEIHAALPIPDTVGSAEGPHQPIIDLYPTFIAQDSEVEQPKPGDIVNVDFGNKNTYSDPIYLGPLLKSSATPGAGGAAGGAGIFGNCGASTPVPAVSPPQPTPSDPPQATSPNPDAANNIDSDTGLPTYALDPTAPAPTDPDLAGGPEPVMTARPPEFIFGMQDQQLGISDPNAQFGSAVQTEESANRPLGSVYVFGDSNTQGQQNPLSNYFSGFNFYFNSWYGGAYRMAYKDTPKDLVKGKNLGESIDSYDYQYGDTVIIGSIGGNKSFGARNKYPSIYAGSGAGIGQYTNETITESLSQPPGTTPDSTWPEEAKKYGLEKLLSDQEESFTKFCATLLSLKHKGVNIIIFGLPYGGKASRQEDREWFDIVQFASLAAFGLGANYVSTIQQSKLLKAGDNDVHYFPGNGGVGYQKYFDTLLRPYLDSYYQLYEGLAKGAIPLDIVTALEDTQQEMSLPDGENASEKAKESMDNFLNEAAASDNTPAPTPTLPPQHCIGSVGDSAGGKSNKGKSGKSYGVPDEPFNGGKANVIVLGGVEYPFDGIRGSDQFKTRERKSQIDFITIHNSVTKTYQGMVNVLRDRKIGVHFTIDLDGTLHQHSDPVLRVADHGSPLNNRGIGIEVITRYYYSKGGTVVAPQPYLDNGWTESDPHWWMGKKTRWLRPPEKCVDANNRLMSILLQHIPTINPEFISLFLKEEGKHKRMTSIIAAKYTGKKPNRVKTADSVLKRDTGDGGLTAHRDYTAKADGRYFLERFYEFYTGQKFMDFH